MRMIRILSTVTIFVLIIGSGAFGQNPLDSALSEYVAAGMAYKEGRYNEAIERYTAILENGLESGPLHYNLANSYFKVGQLGKAVLHFEKAKRLIPRDSDLKFNSAYAASEVTQYVEEGGAGAIERALREHIEFYTYDEMAMIVLGLMALLGMVNIFDIYRRQRTKGTIWAFTIILVFIALFVFGIFLKFQTEAGMSVAVVDANTYFEPRSDSTVHFKLSEGMKARIIKVQGNWDKVERADGKQGWVDKTALEEI